MSETPVTRGGYCKIPRSKGEFITVQPDEYRDKKKVTIRTMYLDVHGDEKFSPKGIDLHNQGECDMVCKQIQRYKETLPE